VRKTNRKKNFVDTDLLIGICSLDPETGKHFFLADFDDVTEEELMDRVGKILVSKYQLKGKFYLIKSGKGLHLISFSNLLDLKTYVKILKEMKADEKFIFWVKKVKYGILRLSRRSSHRKVPKISKILLSPYPAEDSDIKYWYFVLLNLEEAYDTQRVIVCA